MTAPTIIPIPVNAVAIQFIIGHDYTATFTGLAPDPADPTKPAAIKLAKVGDQATFVIEVKDETGTVVTIPDAQLSVLSSDPTGATAVIQSGHAVVTAKRSGATVVVSVGKPIP